MKVTKEELANIIKEEVEKALEEQVADFPSFKEWWQGENRKKYPSPSRARRGYSIARSKAVSQTQKNLKKAADSLEEKKKDTRQDIEDQFRSKIAGPGRGMFGKIFQGLQGDDIAPNKQPSDDIETDADGIPLKAPFPPGIKTTKELIKNFSPKSDERKLFRKWYTKYGPGSKRKKTAAKPISKGKKLPNVKAPAYDPKKDKFAGSYPELDTPSGIDPVQHAMDRAYDAEVKGQYRVARRFFRFACKNDYKSKTSGKNTACAKAKEMTAKMDKGMGIQKGSDFDKSRSEPKPKYGRMGKKAPKKVKTFVPDKGFVDDSDK
jgi:hypothetical protein